MKKIVILVGMISMLGQSMGVEFMGIDEAKARTLFKLGATDSYTVSDLENKKAGLFNETANKGKGNEIHIAFLILSGLKMSLEDALKKFPEITDVSKETPESLKKKWVEKDTITISNTLATKARNPDRVAIQVAYVRLLAQLEKIAEDKKKILPINPTTTTTTDPLGKALEALTVALHALGTALKPAT